MITTMPITKARVNLGAVVEGVSTNGDQVILERAGNPIAAIINIDLLESILDGVDIARIKKSEKKFHSWDDIKHEYGL